VTERFSTGTLVDVFVPEETRAVVAAACETPLHPEEQGYLSHYDEDDAIVMILGGPTISVPDFCVVSAEHGA
jgi:hypothetical protein